MPTLSILIVSYNSRDLLGRCLSSVAQQTKVDHEVIVVDNASADGTPKLVASEHPEVKLIANTVNYGFAVANNMALKVATGRFRVLLNPDTLLLDRTLDRLVEFMEAHPDVGIAGGKMVESDGSVRRYETWYPSLFAYLTNSLMLRFRGDHGNGEVEFVSGSCLMIREVTMQQIGLLDEDFFMYNEDVDWCLRAKRAGWRVYHCADARLFHVAGGSSGRDVAARVVNIRHAKLLFFKKHYNRLLYWSLKGIMFLESATKILFDVVTYALADEERRRYKRSRMRGYARLVQSLMGPPTFMRPTS